MRHKIIGPCCGKEDYCACGIKEAKTLDDTFTALVEDILNEDTSTGAPTSLPTVVDTDAPSGVPTPASSVLPTRGDGTNAPTPQTLPTVITNKPTTAMPSPTPKTPLPIANPDSCDVGP